MREIWKYPLEIAEEQYVVMPRGSELLHVAEQDGQPMLWARVVPTGQTNVERMILIRGTGHSLRQEPYVGTVLTSDRLYVWHIFDGGEQ